MSAKRRVDRTDAIQEEYEVKEVVNGRRGVKRQKKASPLYFTYRPLMSEDKDKAPTIATVDNTNEASNLVNRGSYHRVRKMIGDEK